MKTSTQTYPSILAALAFGIGASVVTGCASDPEATATIAGALDVTTTAPPSSGTVMMFWVRSDASDAPYAVGQHTASLSQFPSDYVLDLTAPPPDDAINDYGDGDGGGRAAFGLVLLTNPSLATDLADITLEQFETEVYGGAEHDVVAYLPDGAQPGSEAATLAAGAVTTGYHLLQVDDDSGDWPVMHEVELSTAVDVRIADVDDLAMPLVKGSEAQGSASGGSNSGSSGSGSGVINAPTAGR